MWIQVEFSFISLTFWQLLFPLQQTLLSALSVWATHPRCGSLKIICPCCLYSRSLGTILLSWLMPKSRAYLRAVHLCVLWHISTISMIFYSEAGLIMINGWAFSQLFNRADNVQPYRSLEEIENENLPSLPLILSGNIFSVPCFSLSSYLIYLLKLKQC